MNLTFIILQFTKVQNWKWLVLNMVLDQGLSGHSQVVSLGYRVLIVDYGWMIIDFQVNLRGCWQKASVYHHIAVRNIAISFSPEKMMQEQTREHAQDAKLQCLLKLNLRRDMPPLPPFPLFKRPMRWENPRVWISGWMIPQGHSRGWFSEETSYDHPHKCRKRWNNI